MGRELKAAAGMPPVTEAPAPNEAVTDTGTLLADNGATEPVAEKSDTETADLSQFRSEIEIIFSAKFAEMLPAQMEAMEAAVRATMDAHVMTVTAALTEAMPSADALSALMREHVEKVLPGIVATLEPQTMSGSGISLQLGQADQVARDDTAKAAHQHAEARHAADAKEAKARAAAVEKRDAAARADYAAAVAMAGDSLGRMRLDDGSYVLRLAEDGRFIPDCDPIPTGPADFTVQGGRASYRRPVSLSRDLDAVRVTEAWLVGNDTAVCCEIPQGIAAGGGVSAQLPPDSLIF